MDYDVRPGDSVWKIAARELGDSSRWREIAELNRLRTPYFLFVGQALRLPPRNSVRVPNELFAFEPVCRVPEPTENLDVSVAAVRGIVEAVDRDEALRGAAVVLIFPSGDSFQIREARHASGLVTVVLAKVTIPSPADPRTWWQRWNGVVLSCGGAALSIAAVGLALAAEVPTFGASTPLVVLGTASTVATSAQCGLAVAKQSSHDFHDFVQSDDGRPVRVVEAALDLVSLAGGVSGAIQAVRTGGRVLQASNYAKQLNTANKGKLLKTLERIERQEKDLIYFRESIERLIRSGKVADPARRGISNNLIKRSLPYMTRSLRSESLSQIVSAVGTAVSITSSYQGGVISTAWGSLDVEISVLQEKPS